MSKPGITKMVPYDSPGTLDFWCQKSATFQRDHPQWRHQIEMG